MEWLNYHHLRYFWTVAREGSLKKAAEKLRVSQPSISAQLSELEEVLGEKLFRRSGRNKVLTDAGQIALRYADEIFSLGREMVNAIKQRPTVQALRLYVGVADSFPKLVTHEILRPVFSLPQAIHVICREGKLEDLLEQLTAHRLDIVLADETASSATKARTFNHPLGESSTSFCASGKLAATLRKDFPKSLHEAPALLPSDATSLRRAVEVWFRELGIQPRVVAEFEDLALMQVMAAEGRGFIALPSVVVEEATRRYGFRIVGQADTCRVQFHAITAERRIVHPAVARITGAAAAHSP
ncbi:MAG TPA: LysR family transcriptional regulator [Candidatus Paceibacterota bacterium]|nr:LysR family transcriptional regulator [Verrucomicrobiota bacterium]HRY47780.1 LysR family transcriptional regulator [Candidatus Paceibacterota bacterium]